MASSTSEIKIVALVPIDSYGVESILAHWNSNCTIPAIVKDLQSKGYDANAIVVMNILSRHEFKYARSGLAEKGALTPTLQRALKANGNSAVGRIIAYSDRMTVATIDEELSKRGYESSPELVRLVLEQNGIVGQEGPLLFPSFDYGV